MFQEMSELMNESFDLNITIRKTEGQLTLSILPKPNGIADKATDNIVPLIICGTPEEIDNGLIEAMSTPIINTGNILLSMKNYEENLKVVAASNKQAQDNKKKVDEHITKAKGFIDKKDFVKANAHLVEARKLDPNNKDVLELTKKSNAGYVPQSLFTDEEPKVEEYDPNALPPVAEVIPEEDESINQEEEE